jgi:hypothetical protein
MGEFGKHYADKTLRNFENNADRMADNGRVVYGRIGSTMYQPISWNNCCQWLAAQPISALERERIRHTLIAGGSVQVGNMWIACDPYSILPKDKDILSVL